MTEHGHAPELQSVFRVHLPPLSQRLRELDEMLRNIVKAHKLSPQWAWLPDESLAEYLGKLPHNDETARVRIAIERQVRYANRSSDFSSTVGPHFALGVDHYARFTAPMREIVGIFTHKEALEVLGFEPPNGIDDDIQLRDRVIEAANRGNATQRAIDKEIGLVVIRDIFDADLALPKNQRPIRPGTVVGLRPTQIYILLDDLPVDVKIWVEHLQEHTGAQLDLHDSTLTSSQGWAIRIGDEIRIQASHFDQGRQHVVLVPIFD
jgi:ribonuclease R